MELTNTQLLNYVERIKFGRDDKAKYQTQIDTLKENVEKYIQEHTDCKVIKTIQSGSWKKGTILYPKEGIELDIDLVFFIDQGDASDADVRQLNEDIKDFLYQVYPNKTKDDFWDSPKTAGVVFKGTGLSFDIVPVIPIDPEPYVWQPEKGSRGFYYTSIEGQLTFNSNRKRDNSSYTAIVRILKKWKNIHDLKISSFAIELIVGWLDLNLGIETKIEEALLRFFNFIGKKQYPKITFNAPYGNAVFSDSIVYIGDPTYNENNVLLYVNAYEWEIIREAANSSLDTIVFAQLEEYETPTVSLWKEIFSPSFSINPNT